MTPKQRQMIYVVYITWRYYLRDWLVSGWRTSNILHQCQNQDSKLNPGRIKSRQGPVTSCKTFMAGTWDVIESMIVPYTQ